MKSDARAEIASLLFTYAGLVDAGDFDAVGRLFAHGRLTDGGALDVRGAEAVAALYRRTTRLHPDTGTPKTQHLVTNLVIEVDEQAGTASCNARYSVLQQTATLPLQPIIAGRYADRFERADGAWRFVEKRFFVDLVGDVSQHLLVELHPTRDP